MVWPATPAKPQANITIQIDADLAEWLLSTKNYQQRINMLLRSHMDDLSRRPNGGRHPMVDFKP